MYSPKEELIFMQKKKPCGMKFYAWRKREGNLIFVECRNFQFSLDGNLFTFFVSSYPPSSFRTKDRTDLHTATVSCWALYYVKKLVWKSGNQTPSCGQDNNKPSVFLCTIFPGVGSLPSHKDNALFSLIKDTILHFHLFISLVNTAFCVFMTGC